MSVASVTSMNLSRQSCHDRQEDGQFWLSIEECAHPCYLVKYDLELIWANPACLGMLINDGGALPSTSAERRLFRLVDFLNHEWLGELIRFQLALVRQRITEERFASLCDEVGQDRFRWLQSAFVSAIEESFPVTETFIDIPRADGEKQRYRARALYFREGVLVYLLPDAQFETLSKIFSHRDLIIRSVLPRRLPVETNLAVLITDLQGSSRVSLELPPEEYFTLINDIRHTVSAVARKHHAAHGKHVGDGHVYFFFPEPDTDYLYNALSCAMEIRAEIRRISERWQETKRWDNELFMNTGVHEGSEYVGMIESDGNIELMVLGDTINQTARISEVARNGAIWASKSFMNKLSRSRRDACIYGLKRGTGNNEKIVRALFTTVSALSEQLEGRGRKFNDIASLPITQVFDGRDNTLVNQEAANV